MVKKTDRRKKQNVQVTKALPMPNDQRNRIILGLIIAFTTLLFGKSVYYTFIGFDDPQYVIDNDLIKDLSFQGLKEIFTTPIIGMYNPLTFLVYSLEYKLFGLNPQGYHTFNLIFHLIATIMAYKFILRLTKRYETAAIVALLFAIHPMHVGVVTWVSQTKTSLCVIFYFSALYNYVKYVQENLKVKYLLYVGLFFILAALSKPSAVTLAPMLFLLDYYLSRKFEKRVFLEKIPFLMISLFFGILTLLTHAEDSIFVAKENYSFINDLLIANYSIVFYINKLFLPLKLSVIYPYPDNTHLLPLKYYLSIPVIPIILLLVYKAGKFRKEMIFGLCFFVIAISILIRIVPTGFFGTANRYSYLSYTGLFFIIAQFFTYVLDNKFSYAWKFKNYIMATLVLFIVFFAYRTSVRVNKWQNSITLFDDVIKKYPKVPVAYANRGYAKSLLGDSYGAWVDYNTALALDPEGTQVYLNRALVETRLGKYKEALVDFNKVIELSPDYGAAFFDRALIKINLNDTAGALEDFEKASTLGITQAAEQIELLKSGTTGD